MHNRDCCLISLVLVLSPFKWCSI